MQIRFLLGPAGSGKTFRCLSEIREILRAEQEGPPLVFVAPKQATFQLERRLLADDSFVRGPLYSRAEWVVVPFRFKMRGKRTGVTCISSF